MNNSVIVKSTKTIKDGSFKKEIDIFIFYIYFIFAVLICVFLPNENLTTSLYYCFVILSAVMFAWFAQNSRKRLFFKFLLFLSFSVLFFTLGFRNFSGIDDGAYISIFMDVSQFGWLVKFQQSMMEPGYLLLNYIVSVFTDNYLYMQLVSSFIPLFLFYHGFTKYKNIISIPTAVFLLSTMLYFQMLSASLVRMFIAISIIFIALNNIPTRRPIKYIVLVCLASLFHYSSFTMIFLAYFAINKENLSKKATKIYFFSFLAAPVIFLLVAKFLVPLLGSRYSQYGSIGDINISLSTFSTLPLICLLLLFYKKFTGSNQLYFKLFLVIYSFSIIISLFSGIVSLGRLIFYSYAAFILAAAMVVKLLNRNSNKIIFSCIVVLYGFLYVYKTQFTFEPHIPNLFPYQNIFFTL